MSSAYQSMELPGSHIARCRRWSASSRVAIFCVIAIVEVGQNVLLSIQLLFFVSIAMNL